jgi:hypothetical protein
MWQLPLVVMLWHHLTQALLFLYTGVATSVSVMMCFFLGDPSSITHVSYTQFATHITFYFNNFCILQGKKLSIYATIVFFT